MISSFRFGWIDYFQKKNILIRITQFLFGILFLHSRQIAYCLFRMVSFKKNDKILDLGCGDGCFSNWISYNGGIQVTGIDLLDNRISNARATSMRYNMSCKYNNLDIESVVFAPNSFSKILIIDVLEHIKNPKDILRRCYNWISSRGIIFISVPKKKQKRWLKIKNSDFFSYGDDEHKHDGFEEKEILNWLNEIGFTIIKSKEIFYSIYQIIWELLEPIRIKYPNLYRFLVPFVYPLIILDRVIPIGPGNGLIVVAQKL
ncbi:MAG: methyltransferase domain-containing protein [Patescibacteria group bacterium]